MKIEIMEITKKVNNFVLTVFVAAFFLVSCTGNDIYHQYVSIDKDGWNASQPAVFNVEVTDTISDFDVVLNIRSADYTYQNLFLFAKSMSPDSIVVCDTLNCILADNQGKWLGKGIGSTHSLPILYMSNINFPRKGLYTFQISQGMRENSLKGISDIGLRIQRVEE